MDVTFTLVLVAGRAAEAAVPGGPAAALPEYAVALVQDDDVERRLRAHPRPLVVRRLEEPPDRLLRRAQEVREHLGSPHENRLAIAEELGDAAGDQRLARPRRAVPARNRKFSLLDDKRAVNLFCAPQRAGAGRARGAARNARASRATRAAT